MKQLLDRMRSKFHAEKRRLDFIFSDRWLVWKQIRMGRKRLRIRNKDTYPAYSSNLETTNKWLGMNVKELIMKLRKPEETLNILEVGIGTGETQRDLQGIEGVKLHGTNLRNEKGFVELKKNGVDIRLCHMGQLEEKFGKNSMGLVFASNVIGHSQNHMGDLEQMCKIVAPGGRLLFNDSIFRSKRITTDALREFGFKVFKVIPIEFEFQHPDGTIEIKKLWRFYAEKL